MFVNCYVRNLDTYLYIYSMIVYTKKIIKKRKMKGKILNTFIGEENEKYFDDGQQLGAIK